MEDIKLTADLFEPLSEEEKNSEFIAAKSKTYLQDAWGRFKKNKLALAGLAFLIVMTVLAITVPMFSPFEYDLMDLTSVNLMPSLLHPMGTDKFGRDIFVRIMYGARISLSVGFASAFICLFIGIVYGGIAGYVGGKVDMVLMRIVDIIYSIPTLLIVILIMLIFGSNIVSILIGLCATAWMGMARLVRAQVLSLKEQEFALAAYVLGASKMRILFKHLIINCMGPIIVNVTLMVPSAIFTEAFLSFVGIGISAPAASWGTLANEARSLIESHPIQIIWPVASICLTMLSLNFIGDGVSDAFDPKKK
ncbi:MAG: ABC transporter permease [Clostridia bacterium]|nr:ABC transporter permease [Clostridia bacterium]MBR5265578.1 ABC transporter permease [Clostridia bacterium]